MWYKMFSDEKPEKPHPKSTKKTVKRTKTKQEKDPNAPKRPSNPFFQFCQDQRQTLQEQLTAELKPGEALPTKQELTRQLAIKWKSLSLPDKKVFKLFYNNTNVYIVSFFFRFMWTCMRDLRRNTPLKCPSTNK